MPVPTPPTVNPAWATSLVYDPSTNAPNRVQPASGSVISGFNRAATIPRQTINYLFYSCGAWIVWLATRMGYIRIVNGNGTQATIENSGFIAFAVKDDSAAQYAFGIGRRGASGAPTVSSLGAVTLAFGSPATDGSIPITGADAANVRMLVINFPSLV